MTGTTALTLQHSQMAHAIANPGALGTIDAYISTVNRLPVLTAEREVELARSLRDDNNLDAARELVLSHLRLVVSVARQYLGYGLPHADLIQEGNVGLMKAVKRFDPERGVRLVSFAVHWIKSEIHEYIVRNWRLVKVATTKAQRKLFFNLRSMRPDGHTLDGAQSMTSPASLACEPKTCARWKCACRAASCRSKTRMTTTSTSRRSLTYPMTARPIRPRCLSAVRSM